MLNFNTNIQEVINTQTTTSRTHSFCEYNSKKKLLGSNVLTQEQGKYIQELKNTFTFYLHESGKYIVITMYYSSTKTYEYLVVNLENFMCCKCESVKLAKQGVLEILQEENKTQETTTQETTQEQEVVQETKTQETKSKKNK